MCNYRQLFLCSVLSLSIQACDSSTVKSSKNDSRSAEFVSDLGAESLFADSANLDIGGNDLVYAPFCRDEPFASAIGGTYKGVIANEIFSEFSRCEFDITLTIDSAGADNQSCDQTGTLSFSGAQTVSSDFPSVCGSISDQQITIGWDLQDYVRPTDDGSQVNLVRDISYPLQAFVTTWGIELFPEENDQGVQIEYPGVLFSLQLNRNLTITGGDSELYTGTLKKIE